MITPREQLCINLLSMSIDPRTGHPFPYGLPTLEDWRRHFPDDAGVYPHDDDDLEDD